MFLLAKKKKADLTDSVKEEEEQARYYVLDPKSGQALGEMNSDFPNLNPQKRKFNCEITRS